MRRALVLLALLAANRTSAASLPAVEAEHAMVVSEQSFASEAGLSVLRQGGNAVDAAVATAYALAVAQPCCGNIGGGGYMLIRLKDGSEKFIDFREVAPGTASRDMYLDGSGNPLRDASRLGWKAVAVPGTVAGLEAALQSYGSLGRAKVMAPAIKLARDGFVLGRADTAIIDIVSKRFAADPAARKIFLRPDGSAWQPGDVLRQSDLARTLEQIAKQGRDGFYRGAVADALVAASGGLLSHDDLSAYQPIFREPLHCAYRGVRITTSPPSSSSGIGLCEMLAVLNGYDLAGSGYHSAQTVHLMTETMRSVFRDRNTLLGDPAFIDNPIEGLLSAANAEEIRNHILPDKATASDQLAPASLAVERPQTTHFSVVDRDGNAVAVTYTLNGWFGAAVMALGTGFFLNDEMDDFTVKPGTANMFGLAQGARNMIAPGKRPLSSMAPTIISKNGKLFMVLGSPGGSRISTHILQTVVNIVDFGMTPQEAVDAPRFHHQFQPDKLYVEPFGFSADTARILTAMGYSLADQPASGAVSLILRAPEQLDGDSSYTVSDQSMSGGMRPGRLYGARDARRPAGAAVGY